MIPSEEVVKYSAMTGQALYYMGEGDLKHRVLAVAEEAGASRASYALKLLQSEGEISIASTFAFTRTGSAWKSLNRSDTFHAATVCCADLPSFMLFSTDERKSR